MQPKPPVPYMKDGWLEDTRCSSIGPSALFQRWNYQIRQSYGFLDPDVLEFTNSRWSVLLITRPSKAVTSRGVVGTPVAPKTLSTTSHSDSIITSVSSRIIANQAEVELALNEYTATHQMSFRAVDINTLSFEQQVSVLNQASIVIGMHGTAIASTIHMAIGTNYCCGVIEILPQKEFGRIHAFGNMVRRLGGYHRRLTIPESATDAATGSTVDPESLISALDAMRRDIDHRSSCMLPSVLRNPYL